MSSKKLYDQYKEKLELIRAQIAIGPDSMTDDMIVEFYKESPPSMLNEMDVRGEDLQYVLTLITNILEYVEIRKNSIQEDLCQIRAVSLAKNNYQKQMK